MTQLALPRRDSGSANPNGYNLGSYPDLGRSVGAGVVREPR